MSDKKTDEELLDSLAKDVASLPEERRERLMEKLENKTAYRVSEVATLLDMSETTIRRKLRDGEISGAKTGKGWRVSRPDLEAWYREKGGDRLFAERPSDSGTDGQDKS